MAQPSQPTQAGQPPQQAQQKPQLPQRSGPYSLPVMMMVVGGALAIFPWIYGAPLVLGNILISLVGAAIAGYGFWKSK